MNTKIPEELKDKIYCKVHIYFGREVKDARDIIAVDAMQELGNTFNLETSVNKEDRYCCSNYHVVRINGDLSFREAEKFMAASPLRLDLFYNIDDGFRLSWDNRY